jgi:hypothetical protein
MKREFASSPTLMGDARMQASAPPNGGMVAAMIDTMEPRSTPHRTIGCFSTTMPTPSRFGKLAVSGQSRARTRSLAVLASRTNSSSLKTERILVTALAAVNMTMWSPTLVMATAMVAPPIP